MTTKPGEERENVLNFLGCLAIRIGDEGYPLTASSLVEAREDVTNLIAVVRSCLEEFSHLAKQRKSYSRTDLTRWDEYAYKCEHALKRMGEPR